MVNSSIAISGDFTIADSNSIDAQVDVDTSGNVEWRAGDGLVVRNAATVTVGFGTISIDGGGGVVDLGDGSLQSNNIGDAVSIVGASEMTLGDVTVADGKLTLQAVGDIGQAIGTTLIIDRLEADSGGSLDLSNPTNQFATLERLDIANDVTITDSVDDLVVIDVDSDGQDVRIVAPQAILIDRISASNADVRLIADSINDVADDQLVDITAARIFADAQTGIGNLRSLELMSVDELTAISASGDIVLDHLGDQPIELRSVIAGDGAITISSTGTMIATQVVSQNAAAADDDSRDIVLTTRGDQADIEVVSIEALNDADITLVAGDDIVDTDVNDAALIVGDDLNLTAANRAADSDVAIDVTTMINDLQGAVTGVNRGDLLVHQFGSIRAGFFRCSS